MTELSFTTHIDIQCAVCGFHFVHSPACIEKYDGTKKYGVLEVPLCYRCTGTISKGCLIKIKDLERDLN